MLRLWRAGPSSTFRGSEELRAPELPPAFAPALNFNSPRRSWSGSARQEVIAVLGIVPEATDDRGILPTIAEGIHAAHLKGTADLLNLLRGGGLTKKVGVVVLTFQRSQAPWSLHLGCTACQAFARGVKRTRRVLLEVSCWTGFQGTPPVFVRARIQYSTANTAQASRSASWTGA